MYHIQLKNNISPAGLRRFPADYVCSTQVSLPDAWLVRSAELHGEVFPSSLLAIARAGAGVNNIPIDRCSEAGIVVFNTPGANANAVKELTLAGLLLSARKLTEGAAWVRTLRGQDTPAAVLAERGKAQFAGPELAGKRLGVIGLGAVGVPVANAALGLGMEVYAYDPYLSVEAAWKLCRQVRRAASLREIYTSCDFITLHLPLTAATRYMIDRDAIAAMRDGVRLLNFARGELVQCDALRSALDSGRIAAYVTDFADDGLLDHPKVLTFPHLGASTPESEERCAVMAAEQLTDYLANGNVRNSVNLAPVVLPRCGCPRLCVFHRNVPNMIARISGFCAAQGWNIEHMQSASKNDYAYTLVDFTGEVRTDASELANASDLLRVRVLGASADV
jgi:D-3-phosphoglycerate dehydrogenase